MMVWLAYKYFSPSHVLFTHTHTNTHIRRRRRRKQEEEEGQQRKKSHGALVQQQQRHQQLRQHKGEEASAEEGAAEAADREDHQQPHGAEERRRGRGQEGVRPHQLRRLQLKLSKSPSSVRQIHSHHGRPLPSDLTSFFTW
ncbi:hypothetical protein ACQJBY_002921 [Aegilops geniculata]